jgi:hypothetical protein
MAEYDAANFAVFILEWRKKLFRQEEQIEQLAHTWVDLGVRFLEHF